VTDSDVAVGCLQNVQRLLNNIGEGLRQEVIQLRVPAALHLPSPPGM